MERSPFDYIINYSCHGCGFQMHDFWSTVWAAHNEQHPATDIGEPS